MTDLNKLLIAEGGDKYQALLELNIRVAEKVGAGVANLSSVLSSTEMCICLICRIDVQVCNGGYDQYFYYSGSHVAETLEAIDAVGLNELHDNYIEAVKVFPSNDVPANDSERQEIMDKFTDSQKYRLNHLSDQYYQINDPEKLYSYAENHQDDISV